MTTRDDWLSSAISDDRIVAQLLLHIHHPTSSSLLPPPQWGVRHPRSRMVFTCDLSPDKKRDSSRNSPTTPLAWSVVVDSTSPYPRSKAVIADEPATPDANKSKKKMTFAEIKEDEVSLLKERVHFNEEIATLRTTFMEHTATNENLKRIKLDFDLNSTDGATTATDGKKKTALTLEEKPILICRTSSTSQSSSCFHQASMQGHEYLDLSQFLP
ncbi:hypothetical protein MLD38_007102 [Melastoma candidum]|uniref:Uncharacterized protein n=1 Tax=Melastoma candidum TaxID=119954 RepID=A0ACB9RQ66_9MYRT|nr:hypothetical protein MLD38_007102 [Melastoma candidum]